MNQPRPLQIRLPFSVPRPRKGQEPKARICGICRTRDSRYTCPRCNVAYCGLECFRSEKHNQCSEPFYRETLLESISADPAAGLEEKKGMMDMLRRFEEQQGGGEELLAELEEEDKGEGDELAEKLAGVNLDEIDANALFHLLPPEHRERFIAALKNPNSDEAKQLLELAAEEGDYDSDGQADFVPNELPWWVAPDGLDKDDDDDEAMPHAPLPQLLSSDILVGIKPAEGVGQKLVHNAISICVAYLHILLSSRLPSLSKSHRSSSYVSSNDLKADFTSLVPFLADQKSTIRYTSAREAYSAIWESIGSSPNDAPPPDLLVRLLSPLPALLHPPLETTASPGILHLLSDLYGLFSEPKVGAAGKKLAFYVVALGQLGRAEWLKLEREVQGEIGRLAGELGDEDGGDVQEKRKELLL